MIVKEPINSNLYWDNRFTEDWEHCKGPEQSRFFARIAIENLPRWLIGQLRREALTIADWGCAQGDGTDVWASYIDAQQIVGIDFSANAIEQATQRYPAIRFINEDWLLTGTDQGESFDVVFSSNTLEHFHKPYEVLHAIANHAKKAIALILPYKELERIDEHFFSFLPENIPLVLKNGFRLVWSRIVDCRTLPNTSWGGEQILLVYADPKWMDDLGLALKDCLIEQVDAESQIVTLNQAVVERDKQIASFNQTMVEQDEQIANLNQRMVEQDEQIANLNQRIVEQGEQISRFNQAGAERDRKITNLNEAVVERDRKIISLNQAIAEYGKQLDLVTTSISWRLTRPLRWIKHAARFFKSSQERYQIIKSIYWKLPEFLRRRLNNLRHKYVTKHLASLYRYAEQPNAQSVGGEEYCPSWLKMASQYTKIAVIPCAFEFDELVNQRPINAAKYFAEEDYFVLYVAWQWTRDEKLSKGCCQVWRNIHQIPLFEFIHNANSLVTNNLDSLFLLTLPAPLLVNLVPILRQHGFSIVYDIMDEWEEFHRVGQAPWYIRDVEDNLILQSDFVCAVAPSLSEKFSYLRTDIEIIGNGYCAEVIGLDKRGIAGTLKATEKIVGYFGHLTDAWFDWNLLFELAESNKEIKFEIIGYGEPEWANARVKLIENITLIGKIHPNELHNYVRRWSAGIIPFREGRLARAVDPIKIYEYLYFGLPTLVTGVKHIKDYPATVYSSREDIFLCLNELLAIDMPDDEHLEEFLQRSTWRARFSHLKAQLETSRKIRMLYVC